MPGIDGSDTPIGGSGDDILSTLGPDVTGGVVVTLVIVQDPVDPTDFVGNTGPVANALLPPGVSASPSGGAVSPAIAQAPDVGAPPGDTQIAPPAVNNVWVFGTPGQADISGGEGNDTLQGNSSDDVMRGGDGNDSIQGGSAFADINGNKGDDTIDGGAGGSDWLVGGQGDDSITAHHSNNLMLGNLGNDTLSAGDGQDVLRGGQGDDVIIGGAGHDYLSGDLGNDTESGGAGPTLFHGSQNIGLDEVTNFSYAKGDRVELDPGTGYSVSQVGANTVIDMGGGNQMVLEHVQYSTLPSDWLFEGTLTHV